MTSTFALRGRRGTWRHLPTQHSPSFCVAGVALGGIYLGFAWQAWHLWHWAGSGGALGRAWLPVTPRHFAWQAWHLVTSTFALRGKRGTWRHLPTQHSPLFCVAGVELKALGWLWWRAWAGLVAGDAAALCVAGVALMALGWLWWRAWARLVAGRRGTLRGRRGTWRHPPSFCAAGVALGGIYLGFAWQAWHLWHWAGSGGALGRVGRR